MARRLLTTQDITHIAIGAVIIIVCSWLCIPTPVPFTMQSFGVIAVCGIFGRRRSFFSLLVYFLMGMAGLPVFAGFKSGISALLGPTGGYVLGLFFYPCMCCFSGKKSIAFLRAFFATAALYTAGTLWYSYVYSGGANGIVPALSICVVPFIIPDIIKCIFAVICSGKIKKRLSLC